MRSRSAAADAARRLLRNILFFADDAELVEKMFRTACEFVSRVPVYELTFRPDAESLGSDRMSDMKNTADVYIKPSRDIAARMMARRDGHHVGQGFQGVQPESRPPAVIWSAADGVTPLREIVARDAGVRIRNRY